jgi:hypothetical protein
VARLRQLLAAQHTGFPSEAQKAALNLWLTAAGGSSDVAVLLQQSSFSRLLSFLKAPDAVGKHRAPKTCLDYVRLVLAVLELQEVQKLLNTQQLQRLKQQGEAEQQQFATAYNAARVAKRAQQRAEAGGAVGDPAGPGPAAAGPAAAAATRVQRKVLTPAVAAAAVEAAGAPPALAQGHLQQQQPGAAAAALIVKDVKQLRTARRQSASLA